MSGGIMRRFIYLLTLALLAIMVVGAQAQQDSFFSGASSFNGGNNLNIDGTPYYNTDSGWIQNQGIHEGGNTNYITGYCGPGDCGGYFYHGYFSFDLSNFAGNASAASWNVYSYLIQYDPGTYLLYGTSLLPSDVASGNTFTSVPFYSALVAGPVIGSIWVTPANSYQTVTVNLDAAGIAWLDAHAGGGAVLGADFRETPEPGTLMLLGTGLLGALGVIRRKLF
jgi:hypothetical protein